MTAAMQTQSSRIQMPKSRMDILCDWPTAWRQQKSPWQFCCHCGRPVSELWKFCVGCRCVLHKPPPPCSLDDSSSEEGEETTESTRRPPPDDRRGGAGLRSLKFSGTAATDIRTGTGTARARCRSPKRDHAKIFGHSIRPRMHSTDSRMN
jgi:hypothetical protein